MKRTLLALALLAALPALALDERRSTAADQTGLAVTIYNNDLALVKDARKVRLGEGENRLAWREVSARMQPETALLRALDGGVLTLLEQNFDFDLLTPGKLLEKSVGENVRVIRTHPITGTEFVEGATVVSANDGVVLQFLDRVESGVPGRIAFPALPQGLRDRPTLTLLLAADPAMKHFQKQERQLELSYLTGGLGWKADYVVELAGDERQMDMNAWVTLTNTSGAGYANARLQLVAGEVNRAPELQLKVPRMARALAMADAAPAMREETLFEYHLYTLDRPTTLGDNQTKQVALLSAQNVKVNKEYRLHGGEWYYLGQAADPGQKLKPGVFMEFSNSDTPLGVPLPKGIVRVYKQDRDGRAQFIGEDRIEHTARGETVRLRLGEAFDITADRKQTDFQKLGAFNSRAGVFESAYQMEIRNAKKEKVVVKVIEPMPGDWQIVQESQTHRKDNAHAAVWDVSVPAEGKALLTWRVRVKN